MPELIQRETQPYDPTEYLDTDEAVEPYLDQAFQDGDPALIRHALRTAAPRA